MKERKNRNTKQTNIFRNKLIISIVIMGMIFIVLTYFIMPEIQGFPPYSENLEFQEKVQTLTHIEQYTIVFIVGFGIQIILINYLFKRVYKYLNKYYRKEEISHEEILQIRKDCMIIPYKLYLSQLSLFLIVGITFNFIMLIEFFTIIKFTLMVVSLTSLISLFIFIITKKFLDQVLETTYEITDYYQIKNATRISVVANLMMQMIPFLAVILIIVSLLGYAKSTERRGQASVNYYKVYLETQDIQTNQVNEKELRSILDTIPLEQETDYYFIIQPEDKNIYVSNSNGEVSQFMLDYRDFFIEKTNGITYEKFGVDEQAYMIELNDEIGNTWHIGFKFRTTDKELLLYHFAIIVVMMILYIVLLRIWARSVSENVRRISKNLKAILDETRDPNSILPIMSSDEYRRPIILLQ